MKALRIFVLSIALLLSECFLYCCVYGQMSAVSGKEEEVPSTFSEGIEFSKLSFLTTIVPRFNVTEVDAATAIRKAIDGSNEFATSDEASKRKGIMLVDTPEDASQKHNRITASFQNVPLGYLIQAIAFSTRLRVSYSRGPEGAYRVDLHRYSRQMGSFARLHGPSAVVLTQMGVAEMTEGSVDVSDWFANQGVRFSGDASATYYAGTKVVIMQNTRQEVEIMHALLILADRQNKE